jgi:hypothetical protein
VNSPKKNVDGSDENFELAVGPENQTGRAPAASGRAGVVSGDREARAWAIRGCILVMSVGVVITLGMPWLRDGSEKSDTWDGWQLLAKPSPEDSGGVLATVTVYLALLALGLVAFALSQLRRTAIVVAAVASGLSAGVGLFALLVLADGKTSLAERGGLPSGAVLLGGLALLLWKLRRWPESASRAEPQPNSSWYR